MGRNWSPRHVVECSLCGWWGIRVRSSFWKPCPTCGKPRPPEVERDRLTRTQRLKLERSR